jgi:hypothetical protein
MSLCISGHVEPRLVGQVEQERYSRLQPRRPDCAVGHDLGRELGRDSPTLCEQRALGEGEHLHREAQVDRQLEHEPLAVAPIRVGVPSTRSSDALSRVHAVPNTV